MSQSSNGSQIVDENSQENTEAHDESVINTNASSNASKKSQYQIRDEDEDSMSNHASIDHASQSGQVSASNNTTNSEQQDENNFVFVCKIDSAKIIFNILSALLFKKDGQIATVTISKTGIKFTVEESRSFQGNAFLQEDLFQEYKFSGEIEQFKINFSIFMDCLNIYGGSNFVAMQIGYEGYGHSLVILLEDGGVLTHCGLRTLEADELHNFNFRGHPISNKIIMEAEFLKDAFDELDWSSPQVTLLLSPEAPHFRLSTVGPSGSCQVDYPQDSEVFEVFECMETQSNTYKLALLQPAVKALTLASKTQLRVNQIGLLSLQHMIKTEDKNISFVDFFIAPEEEEEGQD